MAHLKDSVKTLIDTTSHNDPEIRADVCPTCGRGYADGRIEAPFQPALSGALDWLVIAQEALSHVQAAIEREVAL